MIIVIHWTDWLRDVKVERFADLPNANAYTEHLPADRTAFAFDTDAAGWAERLFVWDRQFTNAQMLAIFNALPGEQVAKFKDTDAAVRRLDAKIVAIGRDLEFTKFSPSANNADVETNKEVTMPREYKLGEFHQVRRNSKLGRIFDATADGVTTLADAAALSEMPEDEVVDRLKAARRSHGVDHEIDPETKVVTIAVPEGQELFAPLAEPKPEKAPRQAKIGEFKRVRRASGLGKLVEATMAGGTAAEIGERTGQTADDVTAALKSLRRSHGIDHAITEDGQVSLVLPDGETDPFIAVVERTPKERRTSTRAAKGEPRGKPPAAATEFKPIRAGTIRDQLISFMDGTMTAAQIADKIGKTPANTSSHIFCLWRDCGIGFQYDADGKISVVPPEGMSAGELVQRAA